jgi:hypothetical protein
MKKQEIIVFIEIKKHYQVNSENRQSLIIIVSRDVTIHNTEDCESRV